MTDFIIYKRVSTGRQHASGLGLEAQAKAAADHIRPGDRVIAEFVEVESGKKKNRPQLANAIQRSKLTGATILVAKLDRLARNLHFITTLQEAKVRFVAADMPDANELTVHILAAVAEAEAKMISQRTKDALAAAKARGVKLGNDGSNLANQHRGAIAGAQARRENANRYAKNVESMIDEAFASGAKSTRQIAAFLNSSMILSPNGKQWQSSNVSRLIKRIAASV